MSRSREVAADDVLVPFQAIYPGTSQKVAVGAASVQGTAVGLNTTIVRLVSDVDCFVAIGSNPTAVANTGCFLKSGVPEYFGCNPSDKVAVIESTGAGNLYVTEGA